MSFSEARRAATTAVREAWSFLVPVSCAGCAAPDVPLCAGCSATFAGPLAEWIDGGVRGIASSDDVQLAARIVLAYKAEGRTELTRVLSEALVRAVAFAVGGAALDDGEIGGRGIELVTVPTTRAAIRHRGFHPVNRLLTASSLRASPILRWVRQPADQRTLGRTQRLENLRGALVAREDLSQRRFVVVDDVVTTGATSREATRAIAASGGEVRGIAALVKG